ncbi:hypothetical protein BH11MYX4_BH11MYX4_63610 [soil metagenome]
MNRLSLLGSVLSAALVPSVALLACATDNGDAVHGPQFGPTPERPDGAVEGSVDPPVEGGPGPTDGGSEADAPVSTCTSGTAVVLAGSDTTLSGSARIAGGAWTGAAITGGAAKNHPAIVPFGAGFLALTRGPGDALQSLSFAASWSAVSAVGTATTIGAPALAVVGTTAHAVYLAPGAPSYFFRAENAGASWGVTAAKVMSGAVQSFGQSAGSLSAAGAELVFAQDGGDNDGLYTQRYDGAWSVGAPVMGAGTLTTAPPTLAAVDGTFDTVLLYADNTANHVIGFATRDAVSKAWSTAAVTHPLAQTGDQPSLARVSPTGLVAVFRGNDQRPYTMKGTIGASAITWSPPVALLADTSTVDGPPAVAKGICGDEAIAVFASGGQVKATRFRGTSWSVPEAVSGASGTRVSVATR